MHQSHQHQHHHHQHNHHHPQSQQSQQQHHPLHHQPSMQVPAPSMPPQHQPQPHPIQTHPSQHPHHHPQQHQQPTQQQAPHPQQQQRQQQHQQPHHHHHPQQHQHHHQTQQQQQQPQQQHQQLPPPPHHHMAHPHAPSMLINQPYPNHPNFIYPQMGPPTFIPTPQHGHVPPQFNHSPAPSHRPEHVNMNSQPQPASINNHHPNNITPLNQLPPVISTAATGTTNVHPMSNGGVMEPHMPNRLPHNQGPYMVNMPGAYLPNAYNLMVHPYQITNINPYSGGHMPPPSPAMMPARVPTDLGVRQQFDPQNHTTPLPAKTPLSQPTAPGVKPPLTVPPTASMTASPSTITPIKPRERKAIPIIHPLTKHVFTEDELKGPSSTTTATSTTTVTTTATIEIKPTTATVATLTEAVAVAATDKATKLSVEVSTTTRTATPTTTSAQTTTTSAQTTTSASTATAPTKTTTITPTTAPTKTITAPTTTTTAPTTTTTTTTTATTTPTTTPTTTATAATIAATPAVPTTASSVPETESSGPTTTVTFVSSAATTKPSATTVTASTISTGGIRQLLAVESVPTAVIAKPESETLPNTEEHKNESSKEASCETTGEVNNKNGDKSAEEAEPEETPVKKVNKNLPYEAGQYSPLNPNGNRKYTIKFLRAIYNEMLKTGLESPPEHNFRIDFAPSYVNTPPYSGANNFRDSSSGPLLRRSSQQVINKPRRIIVTHSLQQEVELKTAEKPWKPELEAEKSKATEGEMDDKRLLKVFRGHLNKLTPQKYDSLIEKIAELDLNGVERLNSVIDLVFDKAVDEPGFCELYARMCKVISHRDPTFCFLLVKKCQSEFETSDLYHGLNVEIRKQDIEKETDAPKKKLMSEELYEDMRLRRRKYLGTIKLIGEMYKLGLLIPKIIGFCMHHLIEGASNENLECLCSLISTVGAKMASEPEPAIKDSLKNTLNVLQDFANSKKTNELFTLESRIKFKILDTIELSRKGWRPRMVENNPKKIEEIREEAKEELLRHHNHSSQPKSSLSKSDDRDRTRRAGGLPNSFSKGSAKW